MTDWEQLITEGQNLDERASKVQDGETVGLPKDEIDKLTRDYHSWYAKCLAVLPDALKARFRAEFDGTWYSFKIKIFLEAPTQPNILYDTVDE